MRDQVLNRYGTLHGGLIATIVDTVSSAALVTQSERSGMSLNLSVEYHSALAAGDTCLITAQVLALQLDSCGAQIALGSKGATTSDLATLS